MKRIYGFATVVLAVLALSAAPALAGHGGKHHGGKKHACMGVHFYLEKSDKLGLSEDQEKKISEIAWECLEKKVDLGATVKKAKLKVKKLRMTGAATDEVESAIRNLYTKKAEKKVALFRLSRKARDVLDEEQQKKLKEMWRHHHGKRMGMHRPGRMMRPGGMMGEHHGKGSGCDGG